MRTVVVYLVHFARPFGHARHYLGSSADVERRMAGHLTGRGSRLLAHVVAAGIAVVVARTWDGGRELERRLKRRKAPPRLYPICRGATRHV